jgi:hypothetical protein
MPDWLYLVIVMLVVGLPALWWTGTDINRDQKRGR